MAKGKGKTINKNSTAAKKNQAIIMEKAFLAQPIKISNQYRKELSLLNQHITKIIKAVKSAEKQRNQAQKKQQGLLLKSHSSARKELTMNKKIEFELNKIIISLNKNLHQLQKQSEDYAHKKLAFAMLNKELNHLVTKKSNPKKPGKSLRNPTKKVEPTEPTDATSFSVTDNTIEVVS